MKQPPFNRSIGRRVLVAASVPLLIACAGAAVGNRPTPEPDIRITPAPTQNVPGTQTAYAVQIVPTATPQGLYVVKPGDTLAVIANNFETTVDEITALNNIADPNAIEVGQQLIIPSLLSTPEISETATNTP